MTKYAVAIALPTPRSIGGSSGTIGPPVSIGLPVISGYSVVGFPLQCSPGSWDGSGPMTFTYAWTDSAGGALGGTPTNTNTYTPVTGDVGKQIKCTVNATNALGGPIAATSANTAAVVAAAAPVNTTAPVIEGERKVGSQLRVTSVGVWSGQPPQAAMTFSAQWQRNGVDIVGANGEFYVTKTQDINQNVWCRILADNGVAPPAEANSNAINVYSLPVNVTPPLITGSGNDGSADPGEVLQCSTGTWLGVGSNFSYQWRRSVHDNVGSNSNTYVVQEADLTHAIDCVVTKTNEYGPTSEPSSNNYKIGVVLSRSEILLANYANGVAGSFIDEEADADTYLGSMQIKDTVTPANAFLTGGGKLITDKFTFAGQSLRMVEDEDGLIKYGNHNVNLHSANLSSWDGDASVVSNAAMAPNGKMEADEIVGVGGGTSKRRYVFDNSLVLGPRLYRVWFKSSAGSSIDFANTGGYDVSRTYTLNTDTGAITPSTPEAIAIAHPDGWWEVHVKSNVTVASINSCYFAIVNWGDGVYVWGMESKVLPCQFEDEYVETGASPVFMPRIAYKDGVRLGMLAEPQSNNLLQHSKIGPDLTSPWMVQGATAVPCPDTDPMGGNDAVRVTTTGTTGLNLHYQTAPAATTGKHAGSIYLKGTPGDQIYFSTGVAAAVQTLVTLTAEWTRVENIADFVQGENVYFNCETWNRADNSSHLPNVTFDAFLGQLEPGPVATSPIITGDSAVTRLADRMLQSADKWNSDGDEFTLYSKSYPQTLPNAYNSPDPIINIGDNTYEHRHLMAFNRPNCYPPDITWDTAIAAGQTLKMASTVDEAAGGKLSVNGGPVKGNASASSPVGPASISLGGNISGSVFINYPIVIEEFMALRQLVSDADLEALTAP